MAKDTPGAVPADWQGERERRVIDEIGIIGLNTLAAAAYLLAMGMLLTGMPLHGLPFYLIVVGVLLDLPSEIWLFRRPYQYSNEFLRRVITAHYGLIGAAYLILAIALAGVFPRLTFWLYSAFMVVWMLGFLVGEVIAIFIDDRHEYTDRDIV